MLRSSGTSAATQGEEKGKMANQIQLITTATLTVGRFRVPGQKESGLLDLIEVSGDNGTSWSTAGRRESGEGGVSA